MDPQPHPLLHFLVRLKPKFTNVFLQVAKNVEVPRGTICGVRRMLKNFPAKSLKLIPHQVDSMGVGVIMQKDGSVRQLSRTFWLYSASQHPQPPRNEPHVSALLCLLHFQCWVKKLYTTLTYRAINKQLCGPVIVIAELILQTFRHFTYVATHSPTLPSLYLPHSSISNPSVTSPTSQFILRPFFRFSYVISSSLNLPGKLSMLVSSAYV